MLHWEDLGGWFTSKYRVRKLVYDESTGDVYAAIAREKQIKGGSRRKKIDLVEPTNPEWKDLCEELLVAATRSLSGPLPILSLGASGKHSQPWSELGIATSLRSSQ